ncbi:hypothetical protein MtrunA17_Chr7g0253801 [Medicago truncatula]|uniref:Uncharacterized protein n=1 Tax=Medicago truncatula TaxID=3880 RepID=A0A396H2D2_MEDTR|nr:hypothetical protein MtrunA17_Chr7g0253801 [Medicago truncatula]
MYMFLLHKQAHTIHPQTQSLMKNHQSNGEDTCSKNDNGEDRATTSQCT